MNRIILLFLLLSAAFTQINATIDDSPDTIVVARDGTGRYRTVSDAIDACRALMDYHKVISVKRGIYKEKVVIPSWLTNIEILGEDVNNTIITYDDHANICMPGTDKHIGTFRTFTVKVSGSNITFRNITIENNAARLGQAVALHTEGDRLCFIGCRFLGNQDTVYTGIGGTRLLFKECYIEGTTDFIFGPATAWFESCTIHSKANSFITAASTPQNIEYGYIFSHCCLTADAGVDKVYLGRPWRPYASTLFIHCKMDGHIRAEGWNNWRNAENEKTARYMEYDNHGSGASMTKRVSWCRELSEKEARQIMPDKVFCQKDTWHISL